MPRIRTIKPEFFSDPDLIACSAFARLAFIGLWTQADREGRLKDDPRRLKLVLFPGDPIDMDAILEELKAAQFIVRYEVDGQKLIEIRTFTQHQQPHFKEKASTLPAPGKTSASPRRAPGKPRASRADLGTDLGTDQGTDQGRRSLSARADPVPPASALAEVWNSHTQPPIPRCRDVNGQRAVHAKARLTERTLDEWVAVVQRIQASNFCRGENDRAWVASFDWLLRPDTATRVLEGKYDNRATVVSASARRVQAIAPTERTWTCPHTPACTSRWQCARKDALAGVTGDSA